MDNEEISGEVIDSKPSREVVDEDNATKACSVCGTILEDTQLFCPNCGAPRNRKVQCKKCGADMQIGQVFCPNCGAKQNSAEKVSGKKKPIIIGGAIAAIVVVVAVFVSIVSGTGKKAVNFREMFPDLAGTSYSKIGMDGTYLKIDTNPDDIDSDDFGITEYLIMGNASDAIEQVNAELGFSYALYEKMTSTTALQGVQSDSNERYTVTWSYHPDKGLEVIYEIKK